MIRKQIGWLVVGENVKRTIYYETASWYTELILDEGKHPLYASFEDGRKDAKDTSIYASVEGTVVSDSFPSSFGGNIFSNNQNKYVGSRNTWSYTPYAHALAKGILEGAVKNVELFDNFIAVKTTSFVSYREKILSHMIFWRLIMNKNQATNYVIKNARYMEDAPKTPYYVRFPKPYSTRIFLSDDTHDLVGKIFHFANLTTEGRELCKDIDFGEYDEIDIDNGEGEGEDEN